MNANRQLRIAHLDEAVARDALQVAMRNLADAMRSSCPTISGKDGREDQRQIFETFSHQLTQAQDQLERAKGGYEFAIGVSKCLESQLS